jgi:hypothetical protein
MTALVKSASPAPDAQQGKVPSKAPVFIFERSDVAAFRSIDLLCIKAGVSKAELAKLVAKELVDNALDCGSIASIRAEDCGFVVSDDGPGIDPEKVPELFSVARNPRSSKYLRTPTRGAIGNGLRVVVGAVLASKGTLQVCTRGHRLVLEPQENDGTTRIVSDTPWSGTGTEIAVTLGDAIRVDGGALSWAIAAIGMGNEGTTYKGSSSPWWYDDESFFELCNAAGSLPVRSLVAMLDGCSGSRKSGEIAEDFQRRSCASLKRDEAAKLLNSCRESARPVKPKRLGAVGKRDGFKGYAHADGIFEHGAAQIPYVVECWAKQIEREEDENETIHASFFINRTPATADVGLRIQKYEKTVWAGPMRANSQRGSYRAEINIISPFIPFTSEGKHADLKAMASSIAEVLGKATRKAYVPEPRVARLQDNDEDNDEADAPPSLVAEFRDLLPKAIELTSDNGNFRFRQRQLFYTMRRLIADRDEADRELEQSYFNQLVTNYESECGEIAGMLRDPRGSLRLPHGHGNTVIGTETVEEFVRPAWLFHKLIFIEKEGIADVVSDTGWDDRNDCAIIGGKGFSTRAIRDLIDKLAATDEPITVFALHDADAHGTMIYQTLQYETKARGARKINIVNIGLEPWDAIAMGLEVERFEKEEKAPRCC